MHRIGLALGGGGVRGLAHISVLEVLDSMGCKPSVIAGTSMGAIIGALYASGIPGKDIKKLARQHVILNDDKHGNVINKRAEIMKLVSVLSPERARGGLIKADKFYNRLFGEFIKSTFEELEIPLIIIATDYWTAEEVVFKSGELLPAVKASAAIPGVFAPVLIGGRVLVDGGVVNVVPYEHLMNLCDVTIAVDVTGVHTPGKREVPGVIESVLGSFRIMQTANLAAKMKLIQPDIFLHPDIHNIKLLDFHRVEDVFEQSAPAMEELREKLLKLRAG